MHNKAPFTSISHKILWPVTGILFLAGFVGTFVMYQLDKDRAIIAAQQLLKERAEKLAHHYQGTIDTTVHDVHFFANLHHVKEIIRAQNNDGIDPITGMDLNTLKSQLASILKELAYAKAHYAELRLIGVKNNGKEIIRINNYNGLEIVSDDKLQEKSHRDYFQNTLKANNGDIVIGDVSLRVEHGQVITPHKYQLRISTPIYIQNKIEAIVIVNLKYEYLVNELSQISQNLNLWSLSDEKGRYHRHPIEGIVNLTSQQQADIPEYDQFLKSDIKIQIFKTNNQGKENYLGAFLKLNFDKQNPNRFVGFCSFQKRSVVLARIQKQLNLVLGILSIIVIITTFIIYLIIKHELKQINILEQKVKNQIDIPNNLLKNNTEVGTLARTFKDVFGKLQVAHSENKEKTTLLNSIIENAVDAMITINKSGEILSFNKAATEIFGYTPNEVIGKNIELLTTKEHRSKHQNYIDKYLKTGVKKIIGISRELEAERKDGSIVPIQLSVSETSDNYGKPLFSGIIRDLTKEKELEKALADEHAMFLHSSKLSAIGELSAGIGHEINNPLTAVKGKLQKIKKVCSHENIKAQSQIEKAIHDSNAAIDRIAKIVAGLRTFARADKSEEKVFNLAQSTKQTIDFIREVYNRDNISIQFQSLEPEIFIKGNPGRIQQVVMNLITNARDAVSNQSQKSISVSIERVESWIELKVVDNGAGIPKNIQDKVYNSFFTTKPEGKGTGIGLFLSAAIMQENGGKISFSTGDHGTCFTLKFKPEKTKASNPILDHLKYKKFNFKILIIDDEENVSEALSDLLEDLGCNVNSVTNGLQIVELINSENYDCVFIDMRLGEYNGEDVILEINQKLGKMAPALFAMTGGVNTDLKEFSETLKASNVVGYLYKPFEEQAVIKCLENVSKIQNYKKAA